MCNVANILHAMQYNKTGGLDNVRSREGETQKGEVDPGWVQVGTFRAESVSQVGEYPLILYTGGSAGEETHGYTREVLPDDTLI